MKEKNIVFVKSVPQIVLFRIRFKGTGRNLLKFLAIFLVFSLLDANLSKKFLF